MIRLPSRALAGEQRGFVLLSVLLLAVLFFGLMHLLLRESTDASLAAQRFRARIVAEVLAENGAELAARQMALSSSARRSAENGEGRMWGSFSRKPGDAFEILGTSETKGTLLVRSSVRIEGRIEGTTIIIERTIHLTETLDRFGKVGGHSNVRPERVGF